MNFAIAIKSIRNLKALIPIRQPPYSTGFMTYITSTTPTTTYQVTLQHMFLNDSPIDPRTPPKALPTTHIEKIQNKTHKI